MKTRLSADKRVLLGSFLALTAAVSYGTSQVIGRFVVTTYTTPLVASSFALLFGTMAVLFLSAKNLDTIQRPRSGLFYMALAGITSGAGATFMLFASSKAPVAVVAPVASINPLIALILSAIFIRGIEVFSPRVVVGTFLVVAGVILVVVGSDL